MLVTESRRPLLLLSLCGWFLFSCTDRIAAPEPINPTPPDLEALRVWSDTMLTNPILPVAFAEEEFSWQWALRDPNQWSFPAVQGNNWELEADGSFLWNQAGMDRNAEVRSGVFVIPVELTRADGLARNLYLSCVVLGKTIASQTIPPSQSDVRSTLPKNGVTYTIRFPESRTESYQFLAREGFAEYYLRGSDFLVLSSVYLHLFESDPKQNLFFPQPFTVTLSYEDTDQFSATDRALMQLYWSSPEDPLGFVPLASTIDSSKRTVTAQVHRTGLFTLGRHNWSAQNPSQYRGYQQPSYQTLAPLRLNDRKHPFLAHDSVARAWLLGDSSQIPTERFIRDRLAHFDSLAAQSFPGLANSQTPIYITLNEAPRKQTREEIRLSAFSFLEDPETARQNFEDQRFISSLVVQADQSVHPERFQVLPLIEGLYHSYREPQWVPPLEPFRGLSTAYSFSAQPLPHSFPRFLVEQLRSNPSPLEGQIHNLGIGLLTDPLSLALERSLAPPQQLLMDFARSFPDSTRHSVLPPILELHLSETDSSLTWRQEIRDPFSRLRETQGVWESDTLEIEQSLSKSPMQPLEIRPLVVTNGTSGTLLVKLIAASMGSELSLLQFNQDSLETIDPAANEVTEIPQGHHHSWIALNPTSLAHEGFSELRIQVYR